MSEPVSLPLSLWVDRMADDGPRNEAFVRRLCDWLHQHAARLRLDAIEALGLIDVVLTFRMKGDVTLVATGRRPDGPGEVTVRFRESDFPFLMLTALPVPRDDPYSICTLDYATEGTPVSILPRACVAWPEGGPASILVVATVDGTTRIRVQGADGRTWSVPPEAVTMRPAGDAAAPTRDPPG